MSKYQVHPTFNQCHVCKMRFYNAHQAFAHRRLHPPVVKARKVS